MIEIKKVINNGFACAPLKHIAINSISDESQIFCEEKEKNKFLEAIKSATITLDNNVIPGFESLVEAHKLIMNDPVMINEVLDLISKTKLSAISCTSTVMDKYIETFKVAQTTYLQERAQDLIDIKNTIIQILNEDNIKKIKGKFICFAEEIYPSILMSYKDQIVGVICNNGGDTSHSAIICRSKEIPYVVIDEDICFKENSNVIINSAINKILINPSDEQIKKFKEIEKSLDIESNDEELINNNISIMLNASSNDELTKVDKYNLDGVGLYRTEFIFMHTSKPLSAEEQTICYKDASSIINNKYINFRTFDIGDDKVISYIKTNKKGIDNYINNKDVFESQIIALLNSNDNNNIGIMFPMIETYDEFNYLKNWTLNIKKEINNSSEVKIGMMLETKKALESIECFKDVDFISLGTNDLTKELYNIDRDNLFNYNAYIDDLLKNIQIIINHCNNYNIKLSICGEIAGIKDVSSKLYKVGLNNFSVSAACVKTLKKGLNEAINNK